MESARYCLRVEGGCGRGRGRGRETSFFFTFKNVYYTNIQKQMVKMQRYMALPGVDH